MAKTLERIIAKRLTTWCEANDILPNTQYGFRRGYSTADPVVKLHSCAVDSLDMELVYVQFIASFLDQRSVRVLVGVELSASFTPAAGVPQGSVLSPLLYALYCVDIPQPTEHGDGLAQYADDTVYFSSARNSYIAPEQLQALVVRLEEWMRECSVTTLTKATHTDYPGKCYLKEPPTVLSPGETTTLSGKCERVICGRNMDIEIHKCSAVVETKGCKIIPSNPNRPYPECCARIKC
ncbi:uncharacterized protein CBL_05221 [Carabus blaptoides fortunei]